MIKKSDLQMLSCLRKEGRATLTKISKLTQIPISTLYDKIRAKTSLIDRHTCLLNFAELGFNARANISLKIAKEQRDLVKEYLSKHPNVNNLYKINNGYDYMIEVVFKDITELEGFVDTLEEKFQIIENNVYYIINDIKREGFLSEKNHIGLIK